MHAHPLLSLLTLGPALGEVGSHSPCPPPGSLWGSLWGGVWLGHPGEAVPHLRSGWETVPPGRSAWPPRRTPRCTSAAAKATSATSASPTCPRRAARKVRRGERCGPALAPH